MKNEVIFCYYQMLCSFCRRFFSAWSRPRQTHIILLKKSTLPEFASQILINFDFLWYNLVISIDFSSPHQSSCHLSFLHTVFLSRQPNPNFVVRERYLHLAVVFQNAPFANGRFPNGGYSCLLALFNKIHIKEHPCFSVIIAFFSKEFGLHEKAQ